MIHGPCGQANKKSPCMDGSRCTKHFPKKFVDRTTVDEDGYVVYKRRNNGRAILKGGIQLDNRYVIIIDIKCYGRVMIYFSFPI